MAAKKQIVLDPSQQRAVDLVCSARVGIVTGGPGTGKTTCLRAALDQLDLEEVRYELAAPTGKAAKRIAETTGRQARTIHRLLEFHPAQGWRRNARNPVEADVVVVDESSMIDVELAAALFDAIDSDTRLIFIGDADQLPPVGPGRIFGDLVDAGVLPMVRLQTLHRAAQQSWVALNAPKVLKGKVPDLTTRPDFRFLEVVESKDLMRTVQKLVTEVAPKEIDEAVQVLIPQHGGVAGIDAANDVLQEALNPRRDNDNFLPRGEWELRVGDRVIQCRNDYELGVFNGEIGDVEAINGNEIAVLYEGRELIQYTLEQARGLQRAYALTVHRSQGSEFPWVIFVCHSTHGYSLNPQLVYTAITRASKGVILVGDEKGLKRALRGQKQQRNTSLIERWKGELEPAFDPEAP